SDVCSSDLAASDVAITPTKVGGRESAGTSFSGWPLPSLTCTPWTSSQVAPPPVTGRVRTMESTTYFSSICFNAGDGMTDEDSQFMATHPYLPLIWMSET